MMRSQKAMSLIVVALVLVMSGLATAQDPPQPANGDAEKVVRPAEQPRHIYLKLLNGKRLHNAAGEDIGPVDEVIIDLTNFRIQFAVVATGGYLGIGDRLTAIPYSLLAWRMNEDSEEVELHAEITRRQIEMAPAFDYAQLAVHLADENWRRQTKEAFGVYPEDAVLKPLQLSDERVVADLDREKKKADELRRFRSSADLGDIRIMALKDDEKRPDELPVEKPEVAVQQHESAGEIRDFILNCEKQALTAVVLELPETDDEARSRIIIPTSALKPARHPGAFKLEHRQMELRKAPGLKEKDAIDEVADEKACKNLKSFYGTKNDL